MLTPQETDRLLSLMGDLVKDGKTVVFISHKLDEVMRVSNRISVMRDGRVVHTVNVGETNARELARMMVGRDVRMELPRSPEPPGPVAVSYTHLDVYKRQGIVRIISDIKNGKLPQSNVDFGLKDTDVIRFTFNDEAARSIPQDLRKHLEEVSAKIVAGEIQTRAK